ncbi:CheR family methyltransferase [Janthinobacterium agaricidamnosum]|uniref:protein-glutamate O-methyltransferase n=1 Tax=Janthinobacterium agaricidamnosum NBRC 102515 = DSM 9628 TaxID=1349767 RepID=W0V644_9BURK|nr:protein-glutamate O-methyltransferase CheR [Janthinobacterium agaricidamnosum]CDG83055.1 cheR methyltransferase, all-alpha domain protein [Janthinobacterium agaricidamnosum NBRC 102515 = DSM 9628]
MDTSAALTPDILSALIALVRKHTGIAMTERKSILLERRLQPRLKALALHSYQDYLERVESDRAEIPHFIDLVTTNDTLFFRTPQVWDYFARQFLPAWLLRHPGKTLKIWSAAAASGEELYSIAMLCEEFQLKAPSFRYQILATDISQQMLDIASAGRYIGRSVERIKLSQPEMAKKYLTTDGSSVQVVPLLKKNVSFAQHNLLGVLRPAQQFDLVFLRNVLIYFDAEHQETVLKQARHSMQPDARLVLGESETIKRLGTEYQFEFPMVYRTGGTR